MAETNSTRDLDLFTAEELAEMATETFEDDGRE